MVSGSLISKLKSLGYFSAIAIPIQLELHDAWGAAFSYQYSGAIPKKSYTMCLKRIFKLIKHQKKFIRSRHPKLHIFEIVLELLYNLSTMFEKLCLIIMLVMWDT